MIKGTEKSIPIKRMRMLENKNYDDIFKEGKIKIID